jgi:hypothetical protein
MRYIVLIIGLLCAVGTFAQEKKNIVIANSYGEDIPQGVRTAFMMALESGLNNSGIYDVVENPEEYIQKLSGEKSFQESGFQDDNQAIEFGHAAGAQYTCNAKIVKVEYDDGTVNYGINFKIIALGTRKNIFTSPLFSTKNGSKDILPLATEISQNLISGKISTQQKKAATGINITFAGVQFTAIDPKDGDAVTWEEANNACKSKGDNWRLPTKDELLAIYHYRNTILGSDRFRPVTYWTVSNRNNYSVYSIDFSSGSTTYISKSNRAAFRCVGE